MALSPKLGVWDILKRILLALSLASLSGTTLVGPGARRATLIANLTQFEMVYIKIYQTTPVVRLALQWQDRNPPT